jgi:hypothetical protein
MFSKKTFRVSSQQKIEARSEGPKFMLSLVMTMSRRSRVSLFRCFRVCKSNKSQWSGTWSVVLFHLTGRIASLLEPLLAPSFFQLESVLDESWFMCQMCEVRY